MRYAAPARRLVLRPCRTRRRPCRKRADTRYCRRMARTDQRWEREGRDPDATMMLPVVPTDGLGAADRTMLIPIVGRADDPTWALYSQQTPVLPPVYPPTDPNAPLGTEQPGWPGRPERAIGVASPVVYPPTSAPPAAPPT